jgi:hypothetical protein
MYDGIPAALGKRGLVLLQFLARDDLAAAVEHEIGRHDIRSEQETEGAGTEKPSSASSAPKGFTPCRSPRIVQEVG